ncbi:MAG TPA: DUF6602 domain-containing protein [Chitinophagaceae bacterium]|nr:DUF6602 domain-containing protein [Chitinophagaceae bacterium]
MGDLNIQNILSSITKEAELVINQSQNILLSGGDGLQGNNFFAGNLVETFIADLLKRVLSSRFDVVNGYIIDRHNFVDQPNLKQVDCIIVDKAFPIFYKFKDLNLYIVTKESVCGIIEIKRNLRNQLNASIEHIGEIIEQARIVKNDTTQTMPFVPLAQPNGIVSPYRSNPIVGIIALNSGYEDQAGFEQVVTRIEEANSLIDFVWGIDGASLLTQRGEGIYCGQVRESNDSWAKLNPQNSWNINIKTNEGTRPEKILMRVFGFITGYLLYTTGKNGNQAYINNYYFNNNIFQ